MENAVCFTGSRQLSTDEQEDLFRRLTDVAERLIEQGYSRFLAGGALGFDELATRVVLHLRNHHPHIRLIIALPCPDWDVKWPSADRDRYAEWCAQADEVVAVCDVYHAGCMQSRNRYLVDHSDVCVCYQKTPTGGTAYTVAYAEKQGKRIIRLKT